MISEKEIRNNLAEALVSGQMDEFEDWFVAESWNVHRSQNVSLQKLVYALELRLAEYSSGHLDEAALREELRGFLGVGSLNIEAPPPSVVVQSGSSLTTSVYQDWKRQPADTSREAVIV
ncbi:MAG: hypothetical protein IT163_18460 [Bryobacterales bacterium]|nr:hypothetical protein [Bryobacterales bacterium]